MNVKELKEALAAYPDDMGVEILSIFTPNMIEIQKDYYSIDGWIFTINPKNVSGVAHDAVLRYQLECYKVLYEHFAGNLRRQIETNEAEIAALKEVNAAIADEKAARIRRKSAEEHLAKVHAARLDDTPSLFN